MQQGQEGHGETNGDAPSMDMGKSPYLMGEKSAITDPEIKRLCEGILTSQTAEIAQMKALLKR